MKKVLLVTALSVAAGVTAALAFTGVAAAATNNSAHHNSKNRFTVVEHADTDTVADIGPANDSLGDVLAFGNPIYNAQNTLKIGSDQGSCIRTKVGVAYECSWTTTLSGGSLVVEGPFLDAGDSTLAITGGTGKWAAARGQMTLHARNAAGTAYDFTFDVRH
ncbi:dirigent protein [Jatrophihabitans sp. DSM 45814]